MPNTISLLGEPGDVPAEVPTMDVPGAPRFSAPRIDDRQWDRSHLILAVTKAQDALEHAIAVLEQVGPSAKALDVEAEVDAAVESERVALQQLQLLRLLAKHQITGPAGVVPTSPTHAEGRVQSVANQRHGDAGPGGGTASQW